MTKLYVIVDQSLSKRQQFVQGAHAVAQHLVDFPDSAWKNGSLVMLKTKDLKQYMDKCTDNNVVYSDFIEPYYDNMITAFSALNIGLIVDELKLI